MRDDDDTPSRRQLNKALKHEARPQPPKPNITRVARFTGEYYGRSWGSMAWAPDGSLLAVGGKDARGDGCLEIWNAKGHHEGHSVRRLTHELAGPVAALAWSPDGGHLATVEESRSTGQREVRIRARDSGPRTLSPLPGLAVSEVTWAPDGAVVAVSGTGGAPGIFFLDAASGTVRGRLDGLSGPVAWHPEARLIAACDGTSVVLCDPATGERAKTLSGQQHAPASIGWARHGRYLAVADGVEIRVWDADAGTRQWTLHWVTAEGDRGPDGSVTRVEWLDGGHYLMEFRQRGGAWHDEQGSTCSTHILWDTEIGDTVFLSHACERLYQQVLPVAATSMTPDGKYITDAIDHHGPSTWQINHDLPHWLP